MLAQLIGGRYEGKVLVVPDDAGSTIEFKSALYTTLPDASAVYDDGTERVVCYTLVSDSLSMPAA